MVRRYRTSASTRAGGQEGVAGMLWRLTGQEDGIFAIDEGKTGRRDWTRTNDPHHVKVVL